jgi:hypothetical protein
MFRRTLTLLLFFSLFLACSLFPITIKPVMATETWTDTLTFYPSITCVKDSIRNITNIFSFPLKITVTYATAINITRIKLYQLTANGTTFVQIQNTVVDKSSGSYQPLDIGKTLVFTVYAKASDTTTENETASVSVIVQAEAVETGGGPWYPFIETPEINCSLDTSPNVQLSLGQLISNRFIIHYSINVTNKCLYSVNLTMQSWITSLNDYHIIYYSKNTSLYIEPKQSIIQAFDISIPIENPIVLHVTFDYEHTTTRELLATINVDASHTIVEIAVIVGGAVALVFVLYFGLFKGRTKEGKEISEILTFSGKLECISGYSL